MNSLENELARRAAQGLYPVTVKAMAARLAALGYRFDRTMDCRHVARYMTGPHAGESYPCISTSAREADTGLGFANADARRDDNFRALQDMRSELFAVTRGAILEI